MQLLCVIAFLFAGLLPSLGAAADAAFHGDGSTVFAIRNHGVKLEKEVVVIRHDSEGELGGAHWNTDSTITLYNPAAKTVEVQMGLPNWRSFSGPATGGGEWAISKLIVEADGERGTIKHEEFKIAKGQRPQTLPGNSTLFYDGGYRWALKIPGKDRVQVRTRYSFGGFLSASSVEELNNPQSPFYLSPADLFWKQGAPRANGWKFNESRYRTVAYLVTPGRTWAGKIGSSSVSIQLPPGTLPHLLVPSPSGFSVSDGFVHWRFQNWEPGRPVSIVQLLPQAASPQLTPCPVFDTAEQASAWLAFARKNHFDADSIETVRNALLAKHGFKFSEPKWTEYFKQFAWYRPRDGITPTNFPEVDKKILALFENVDNAFAE